MAEDTRNSRVDLQRENSPGVPPPSAVTELDVSELFRAHAAFVACVVRRAGVAERELHDVVQDVFVVVQRKLPEFEGRSQPRTWLYRIAWNVASETKRRAYRRRELLEPIEEPVALAPDALEQLERCEQDRALWAAVDELDPDKREALIHSEIEERPLHELAVERGIPLKTAFSRLYAARRALQLTLRGRGWLLVPWWPGVRNLGRWWTPQSYAVLAAVIVLGVIATPSRPVPPPQPLAAQVQVASIGEPALLDRPVSEIIFTEAELPSLRPVQLRPRVRPTPSPTFEVRPETPSQPPPVMRVVRTGAADLGLGPFGTSPLADAPFVAPQRHPRARLSLSRD